MDLAWALLPVPGPIRALAVTVSEAGVAWVSFDGSADALDAAARRGGHRLHVDEAMTDPVLSQVGGYLAGHRRGLDLAVDWSLTGGVQRTVLQTLYDVVGYGQTVTYGALAARSGAFPDVGPDDSPGMSARAVGSIMGSNPIPVVVPCHRVLAADGLGGFGGGLPVKRWLLELEGALPQPLDFGTS